MDMDKNSGYVEGRLHAMRVEACEEGAIAFLELEVADGPDAEDYSGKFVTLVNAIPSNDLRALVLYQNLRNPYDSSPTSCDKGTPIGVYYHRITPDSGQEPEVVLKVDNVCFKEPLEEWYRRRSPNEYQ